MIEMSNEEYLESLIAELRKYSGLCLRYCNECKAQLLLVEAANAIEKLRRKIEISNISVDI